MRYALLIFGTEAAWAGLSEEEVARLDSEHEAFTAALAEAGVAVPFGAALDGSDTAKTVRTGAGEPITDGPFAEAKEQIGGLYVIDVPTMADAVSWARRLPEAQSDGVLPGAIEVRPLR
jgi:hypothetical protein